MAQGDANDMASRLRAVLPERWFQTSPPGGPSATPVLDGILAGCAEAWAWIFDLIGYVNEQGRIKTATGPFLDIIATDFFARNFRRRVNEPDAQFRTRLAEEVLRPRATRAAMVRALTDLTGNAPSIFEPKNTSDTGGYDVGGCFYDFMGGYGDLNLPFQCFITALRPIGGGIANVAGYDTGAGGYDSGGLEYATLEMVLSVATDDDIRETVVRNAPIGTIPWLRIKGGGTIKTLPSAPVLTATPAPSPPPPPTGTVPSAPTLSAVPPPTGTAPPSAPTLSEIIPPTAPQNLTAS